MTETADAVVIGAGHNGLVAGNILADAGWDVVVLEAETEPGGALRSAEVTAPGFVNDLFSAFYPLAVASPVIGSLHLEDHGLQWSHAPLVIAHPLGNGQAALLSRDIEETAASLDEFGSGDGDAWRHLYGEWRQVGRHVIDALLRPFPPVRPAVRLARALGLAGGLRFARFALLPARRFGAELFAGNGAPALITGCAMHTDLAPYDPVSGFFGWLLTMLGQEHGFPAPVGGAGQLAAAMVGRLGTRGGVVICNSPVRRIVVRGGTALGAVVEDGKAYRARRAVLADLPAPVLYGQVLDDIAVPARLREDLARFQWDQPTLKVDFALSSPVPWTEASAGQAGTVHLGGDVNRLSDYTISLLEGRLPDRMYAVVGQMTTADKTRSPSGTEAFWAYTHLPAGWTDPSPDLLEQCVERLIETIERSAPGFRDLILGQHVQSPADLQRADASLVGGTVNGGTASLHQQLVLRPTPGLGRAETVVDRLYLAGSSAHPGGGVHGACGANAAAAALLRDGLVGRAGSAVMRRLLKRVQN